MGRMCRPPYGLLLLDLIACNLNLKMVHFHLEERYTRRMSEVVVYEKNLKLFNCFKKLKKRKTHELSNQNHIFGNV